MLLAEFTAAVEQLLATTTQPKLFSNKLILSFDVPPAAAKLLEWIVDEHVDSPGDDEDDDDTILPTVCCQPGVVGCLGDASAPGPGLFRYVD